MFSFCLSQIRVQPNSSCSLCFVKRRIGPGGSLYAVLFTQRGANCCKEQWDRRGGQTAASLCEGEKAGVEGLHEGSPDRAWTLWSDDFKSLYRAFMPICHLCSHYAPMRRQKYDYGHISTTLAPTWYQSIASCDINRQDDHCTLAVKVKFCYWDYHSLMGLNQHGGLTNRRYHHACRVTLSWCALGFY